MISAQVERFADILEKELKPLLPLHYQMLALNKDKVPLRPDYDKYLGLERIGQLSVITLRHSGRLIGYWIAHVCPEIHYTTILCSKMDVFFVHPDYRNGTAAIILMRAVEREMKRRGVSRWWAGEKLHSPVGRLFQAFGMEKVEAIWMKWIGA